MKRATSIFVGCLILLALCGDLLANAEPKKRSRPPWRVVCATLVIVGGAVAEQKGVFDRSPKTLMKDTFRQRGLSPGDSPVKLIQVKQSHYVPGLGNLDDPKQEAYVNQVFESQAAILKMLALRIQSGKPFAVFQELQVERPLDGEDRRRVRELVAAKGPRISLEDFDQLELQLGLEDHPFNFFFLIPAAFPDGIPQGNFNEQQKRVLIFCGAAKLLWYFGYLDKLYPTESAQTYAEHLKINKELTVNSLTHAFSPNRRQRRFLFAYREIDALAMTLRYKVDGDILIVFGRGHDFGQYHSEFFQIESWGR